MADAARATVAYRPSKLEFTGKPLYYETVELSLNFIAVHLRQVFFPEIFSMPKIKFIKENTTIEVEPGANLRKVALKNGIPVYSGVHKFVNCMGNSLCGSCSVLIKKGIENCSPKGVMEKFAFKTSLAAFTSIGHEDEMRLSCQTQVNGDIEVESTPGLNWHGERFWG